MSNIWFRLMVLEFKIRDYRHPREEIVSQIGLKTGSSVLDYGCGPGSYVVPVSKTIGSSGKLYALDALPVAIEMVKKSVAKNGLKNVETILSERGTGLPDEDLDAVLLFDVFHDLEDQTTVLKELHRVLKPNGILSFSDHHMKESDIISKLTGLGLFQLQKKGKYIYTFRKQNSA